MNENANPTKTAIEGCALFLVGLFLIGIAAVLAVLAIAFLAGA